MDTWGDSNLFTWKEGTLVHNLFYWIPEQDFRKWGNSQ